MDVLWQIRRQFKTDCYSDCRHQCQSSTQIHVLENSGSYDGDYPTVGAPARCPWYAWITSRMSPCSTT